MASSPAILAIGAMSLRTRGVYFIMITLAFAQMIYYIFVSLKSYGGDDGLSMPGRSTIALDVTLGNDFELSELSRTGVPGQARVLDVRELWPVGVLEVRLAVRVAGGASYPALFLGPCTPPALARVPPAEPSRVLALFEG